MLLPPISPKVATPTDGQPAAVLDAGFLHCFPGRLPGVFRLRGDGMRITIRYWPIVLCVFLYSELGFSWWLVAVASLSILSDIEAGR